MQNDIEAIGTGVLKSSAAEDINKVIVNEDLDAEFEINVTKTMIYDSIIKFKKVEWNGLDDEAKECNFKYYVMMMMLTK